MSVRFYRFMPWLGPIIDQNLPDGVKRLEWVETGIRKDPGSGEQTDGIVLQSPAGGTMYMSVHNSWHGTTGLSYDEPEQIVEGTPPDPVEPVELKVSPDGRIRMVDLEEWLVALITNSGNTQIERVTRDATEKGLYGQRPGRFTVHWHSQERTTSTPVYTLAPGQKRSKDLQYKLAEAF